jgi:cell division protein FtsI/penicillin-binding protein 2
MAVNNMTPEDHARDLLMNLNSSNLHYSAQVTPFSIYITVRKKFRKTSNFVIPDQSSHQLSNSSMHSETLDALKREFENGLKQKALEYSELKVAKEVLEEEFERVKESNDDLKSELEERYVESHELKITNEMLQGKLQKTEADYIEHCNTVKQEKDTI